MSVPTVRIAKAVVTFIVGAGTTKIVSGIVQNNTDPEKIVDKIEIATASYVIGAMAAGATKQYTDKAIDDIVEAIQKFRNKTVESTVVEDTES